MDKQSNTDRRERKEENSFILTASKEVHHQQSFKGIMTREKKRGVQPEAAGKGSTSTIL